MTREQDFLERWAQDKAGYFEWGNAIAERVKTDLTPVVSPASVGYFLKTPVLPRLKDDLKLVEKAFYRRKAYVSPYEDITDKVGIRFVVLLNKDIRVVEDVLKRVEGWTFSRDRDYEEEQKQNPSTFDYAAVHYVVRPSAEFRFGDVTIAAGTPCEVQIKTILQHAYSELTHDTIYKPQISSTPQMQRSAAKAMALLEATNDYFERVSHDVETILSQVRHMTARLSDFYLAEIGIPSRPSLLEGILLDAYEGNEAEEVIAGLRAFWHDHAFLAEPIRRRVSEGNPVFAQPAVLLVYLEAYRSLAAAKRKWPLTEAEMEPILNDLGESFH